MERNALNNDNEIHFYPDFISPSFIFGDDDLIIFGDSQSFQDYYPFQKEDNDIIKQEVALNEPNEKFQSTLKLTENKCTSMTEKNNKKEKKIVFETKRYLPRGRQREFNPNKKIHSWDSFDLILRKIQVHFLNFLIQLANDFIKSLNEKIDINFLNILYAEKRKVFNRKKLEELKYKDIFWLSISKKNKGIIQSKKTNHKKYLTACNKFPLLKEFFDLSYLKVFEEYYFTNKRIINFNKLNILLSEKTKTFDDLLNKERNRTIKSRFLFIVDKFYFKIEKGKDFDYYYPY